MYLLFGQPGLTGTLTGMILAHTVLATLFVLINVAASLQGLDMSLLKAAAIRGRGRRGSAVCLHDIVRRIVVVLFIGGPSQRTLSRQMFDGICDTIDPSIVAMSSFLLVAGLAGLLTTTWLSLRSSKNLKQPAA